MFDFNETDILVVDDTPDNLRLLIDILQVHGCKVRPATNGKRALAVAQADPPDLILLDILMPGIDGYTVCQQLKADERTRNIPIIFLSALNEAIDKVKAFEVGGVDYITKPFQAQEVLARIKHQLQIRHLSQKLAIENAQLQQEIQQRLVIEAELEQAKAEAEAANQAKSDFLASMSHEIRTPMNAILGFCDLLKQLVTEPREKAYVNSIATSGNLLLALINDILDLSKIEAGKLKLYYEPLNIRKLIEEMQQIFWQKSAEKHLQLIIDIMPSVPGGILFDQVRLRQILFNVIGNAMKFTHQGFVKITVRALPIPETESAAEHAICLQIDIEDTGIGISVEHQSSIFESFMQVEGCASRKYNGTGLGLTITERLTTMLGGRIELDSKLGVGSTFRFIFPKVEVVEAVPEFNLKLDDDLNQFQPATLLVVDDVQSNLDLIESYFQDTPHQVWSVNNGRDALQMAQEKQPNLILLDWRMPDMDGQKVLQALRTNPKTQAIPIIVLTAANINQIQLEAQNLVNAFLSKPISRPQLVTQLKRFLVTQHQTVQQPYPETIDPIDPSVDPTTIKQLPELLAKLEHLEISVFPTLVEKMITRDIRSFMMQLLTWGNEHQCLLLLNYAQALETKLSQFDIDGVSMLISGFPELRQTLSAMLIGVNQPGD